MSERTWGFKSLYPQSKNDANGRTAVGEFICGCLISTRLDDHFHCIPIMPVPIATPAVIDASNVEFVKEIRIGEVLYVTVETPQVNATCPSTRRNWRN